MASPDMEELGRRLILVEPFDREWAVGCLILWTPSGNQSAASLELMDNLSGAFGVTATAGPRMDELLRKQPWSHFPRIASP